MMRITTTVVISRDGKLRVVRTSPRLGKDKLVATLHVDVPDTAFDPPRLMLHAAVAGAEPPKGERSRFQTIPERDPIPWTAQRVRALMARLDLDRNAMAQMIGVPEETIKRWATTGDVDVTFRDALRELESRSEGAV